MNEAIQNLLERRSIRSYKAEQIKAEELETVLRCGTFAPTAMGKQSPKMVVVQEKTLLKKLSAMNAAVTGNDSDPFYGAPTAVLVFAQKGNPNSVQDASLVMGNMLNAAHAIGLGSCWINRCKEMFEAEDGRILLQEWGMDGEYAGVGICILGYADKAAPSAAPRKEGYVLRV